MAPKLLVASFHAEEKPYVDNALVDGIDIRILDCFEETHKIIHSWYPGRIIHAPAHRIPVKRAVEEESFDVAIVHESKDDFVRTALLAQTLRDARVRHVLVVTSDVARTPIYRRCGAHQVVVSSDLEEVWKQVHTHLLVQVSAS
ncbi:hypothetical protein [Alicyclobacillus dauci]|uniref:Uncharacterized protein n=1 Tax=Alicyclobacillus dauci TaxID=1475485 RepID=A0ABY6Z183_9BACL|nr:hypothetical protein [Alicyclobacillus dauci]WAH36586.1 hypothetical protein NZD86_20660 [Alicyclobacillus dauci]